MSDGHKKNIKMKDMSLDDFKILKSIGEGAFGEVYLAKNYFDSKQYALKCIDKKFLVKQKKQHHVYNERLILQNLDSNLVVKLVATFQDQDKLYFLMEHIEHGELTDYLRIRSKLNRESLFRRSDLLYSRDCQYP